MEIGCIKDPSRVSVTSSVNITRAKKSGGSIIAVTVSDMLKLRREDSLPDLKLVLTENGRGVSVFCLKLYKRSDDSYLCDEQQLFYLTGFNQPHYQDAFFQY
ncbi:hypothetical protein TNCV_1274991 [Trichonephila clavipes]|nr:hypothetical protein TNCV_1274991 [Trichonephila clavipes]